MRKGNISKKRREPAGMWKLFLSHIIGKKSNPEHRRNAYKSIFKSQTNKEGQRLESKVHRSKSKNGQKSIWIVINISSKERRYETYYNKILFYNHQIYTNFTSLMVANVSEDAVLEKQTKKKSFLSQGPEHLQKYDYIIRPWWKPQNVPKRTNLLQSIL